ncbi:phage tail protein [Altererythrobacter gangjinensis]|uniref:Phage tail protein n=2 Tax=Pontixanthobacter gangjinensis TaxID=1028742 RepID=A0A6I4SM13_9SPHN|nr:phage tail protein [Pontixanthobacter gangjinensis]
MATTAPVSAGTDAYIGEVMLVGFNFCPRSSASADGQLLAISSNTALFSLLGTIYGGDGRTTFALPDLRGRAAISEGQGPGLSSYRIGERGGQERTTLTIAQMPSHNHTGQVRAESSVIADTGNPAGNAIARSTQLIYSDAAAPTAAGAFHPDTLVINNNGGGQSSNNMQPYLAMRYCVVTQGIFPSRS